MHLRRTNALLLLLTLSACATPGTMALAPVVADTGLGHVAFENSGPPGAQEAFTRGVLLLHSFEYDDAAEAFRAAQAIAPDFALAYWGEAMTYCHPIWREEKRDAALAVLARLGPTSAERAAKAGTARERELLAAVEVLFGEGTRIERARAYCDAMAALAARYPQDLEIAAFHSLAILGSVAQGRDIPTYMRAAAVAEQVLERAPDHPGALHYAIHSYDDPVHAPLGLRMARRYGKVAPSAEHALHMPSHIYVALGMWEDSVAANIDSAATADARRARKNLEVEARAFHSLFWLSYSYLQLGRRAEAEQLIADMRRDEAMSHSKRTRSHLVAMRAARAVALDAWDDELARLEVLIDGLEPPAAGAELYTRGRAALARGEPARTRECMQAMVPLRGDLADLTGAGATSATCCAPSGASSYLPGRLAVRVMELELSGLLALQAGATEEGLAELTSAAEREDAMGFDFGPPVVVEPAHELLGWQLLALGRGQEAADEFRAALKRAPNRERSLRGLERALQAAGVPALEAGGTRATPVRGVR